MSEMLVLPPEKLESEAAVRSSFKWPKIKLSARKLRFSSLFMVQAVVVAGIIGSVSIMGARQFVAPNAPTSRPLAAENLSCNLTLSVEALTCDQSCTKDYHCQSEYCDPSSNKCRLQENPESTTCQPKAIVYQENSLCETDQQCQTIAANYECAEAFGVKRCRPIALAATPTPTPRPSQTPRPTVNPTTTPLPTPEPTPTQLGLTFEAEAGLILPPFVVSEGAINLPSEARNSKSRGMASYNVTIPQDGEYVIKTKVDANDASRNSFYLNFDAVPESSNQIWDIVNTTTGFEDRYVSWRGSGSYNKNEFSPKVFNLTKGPHTLYITSREKETYLDTISIERFNPEIVDQPTGLTPGLVGFYFDDKDMSQLVTQQIDSIPYINVWYGAPVDELTSPNTFSVRWQGKLYAPESGEYLIYPRSDDGVRVFINGEKVVENWKIKRSGYSKGEISLEKDKYYDITIEYFENTGRSIFNLDWQLPSARKRARVTNEYYFH